MNMTAHCATAGLQRHTSGDNHPQLPGMAVQALSLPVMVPEALLATCQSRLDAILLCIQLARIPHAAIAERLGIDKGNWSRMCQGQARFDERRVNELMRLCGNYAPMQYEAAANGFALIPASQVAAVQHMVAAARLVA